MDYLEKLAFLNQDDIKKLKKTANKTIWVLACVEVVFGAIYLTMVLHADSIIPVIFGFLFLCIPYVKEFDEIISKINIKISDNVPNKLKIKNIELIEKMNKNYAIDKSEFERYLNTISELN